MLRRAIQAHGFELGEVNEEVEAGREVGEERHGVRGCGGLLSGRGRVFGTSNFENAVELDNVSTAAADDGDTLDIDG